ncbi:MAG: 3-phosphoshikimate 1-carboxyvinyltransferase [Methyloligellaceae bacterium]
MSQSLTATKSSALKGHVRVPGDKSISHRSLIFGALSIGQTRIRGLLEATDVIATAKAVEALGADVRNENGEWIVTGDGVGGFRQPEGPLDFGNSGTGSRLMMGAVAGHSMKVEFTGDASLCSRPMARILNPLKQMGLNLSDPDSDRLPAVLEGSDDLLPIKYTLPMPSAQVKSAVLIAGLHASGKTTVIEPKATRDHTERMLTHFGAVITREETPEGLAITIEGDAELKGQDIVVPGDPSSAAFLTAAALLCPDSEVTIEGILTNPTRFGFYQTLIEMGADITLANERTEGGEPIADIIVKSGSLNGVTVPADRAPSMIDEYPCLSVVASFANGETRMLGLEELRVKESDRLAITAEGLTACGVQCTIEGDDLIVQGADTVTGGATIRTEMDHRIAMSFLIMGLRSENPVTVDDVEIINTSFPQFMDLMTGLGAKFREAGK